MKKIYMMPLTEEVKMQGDMMQMAATSATEGISVYTNSAAEFSAYEEVE